MERGRLRTEPDAGFSDISRRLALLEATNVDANGTVKNIVQGSGFTMRDTGGGTFRFEFKSGPELQLLYNPAQNRVMQDGDTFTLDGIVYEFDISGGVTPGRTAVVITPNMTRNQFVDAIRAAMPATVNVGLDGTRLNFSGATTGSFTSLVNRGVATVDILNVNSGGAILIDFLAQDTAEVIAVRIANAINALAQPGISATANGDNVLVTNGASFVVQTVNGLYDRVSQNAISPSDVAPGGIVTGTTLLNGVLFAVSDRGGLYRVNNPTQASASRVVSSHELMSELRTSYSEFNSPDSPPVQVGCKTAHIPTYFSERTCKDESGRSIPLVSSKEYSKTAPPVFATGISNLTGLAFSTLDFNLWHESNSPVNLNDPAFPPIAGNGLPATPDGSRLTLTSDGERSWYFGFNSLGQNGSTFTTSTDPGIRNSIDFPGGASGVLESKQFSLSGVSAADQPFLYFNYYLQTQNENSRIGDGRNFMQDSFRVYAGLEDGSWILLTTNNSDRGVGVFDDEFDSAVSGSANTQETFDNTTTWRQARVNLGDIAGQSNVRLRFEFSTAGGFGWGRTGGRGPELRLLAGSRLSDGETVTINNTVFEVEMGASLFVPSGSAIRNNDTLVVEGTTFVFYNGQGAPPASGVVVLFSANQTAETVAQNLFNAIRTASYPVVSLTGLNFSTESATNGNETIAYASASGVNGTRMTVTGTGVIGDNTPDLAQQSFDIDMVRVDLERGATITINASATALVAPLDTFLRLFDAEGNQLAFNNDFGASTNSSITFTVTQSGAYYIGVSASANRTYNAVVRGNATAGGSTGGYQLDISVAPLFDPKLDGVRIQLPGPGKFPCRSTRQFFAKAHSARPVFHSMWTSMIRLDKLPFRCETR